MKYYVIILILLLSLTGCKSIGSSFVEGAEEKLRLKWSEEWQPALKDELTESMDHVKDSILKETYAQIERQEEKIMDRLESVNVKLEDYDRNQDGRVTGVETIELVAALRAAQEPQGGTPLGWFEILSAVILGYGGATGAKEVIKSKMKNNGSVIPNIQHGVDSAQV